MKPLVIAAGIAGACLLLATGYVLGRDLGPAPLGSVPAARPEPTETAKEFARQNALLKADVARLTTEIATLTAAATKAPPGPSAPAASPSPAPAAANAQDTRAKALADGHAFLAAYPDAKEILRVVGKAQAGRNFAHLSRLSGISPAQVEQLENQTADFMLENTMLSPTGGVTPATAELPAAQARALLGDQGYQQYLDYRRMMPLVGFVTDIAGLSIREPLSPDQATALVKTLAGANVAFQSGALANPQTTDWDRVYGDARTFLSPAQLTALQARSQGPRLNQLTRQFLENRPEEK